MHESTLLYIEDDQKRRLHYRFTPALYASNFVPLIVILHGEDRDEALHFGYKMWNVLTPVSDKEGVLTWYGDKDEGYIKALLQSLIEQIADEYECEEDIYLYGNGLGGRAAIEQGILCRANAVFASSSGISLENTECGQEELTGLLEKGKHHPIFYLCDDGKGQDSKEFVQTCKVQGIRVHTDFCPEVSEEKGHRLKKVLDMYEHVPPAYTPQ